MDEVHFLYGRVEKEADNKGLRRCLCLSGFQAIQISVYVEKTASLLKESSLVTFQINSSIKLYGAKENETKKNEIKKLVRRKI